MYSSGQVDWGQAGGMALLGAGAGGAGAIVHHLVVGATIQNAVAHQFFVQTANAVGLPTGMAAANIAGQGAGGAIGSIAFALVMFLTDKMDAGDATRMAAAGTIGSAAGMAAGGGMIALATTYGTAGTGAAISSLSGAAANGAALAWLGGGTLSAGGGGMALGSAIVSGGIGIVVVAATAVVYWGYAEYDNRETNHRHQYNASLFMCNAEVLKELCRRQWYPHLKSVL
jgi:hypothetical protein